jgi:hypothetical protein
MHYDTECLVSHNVKDEWLFDIRLFTLCQGFATLIGDIKFQYDNLKLSNGFYLVLFQLIIVEICIKSFCDKLNYIFDIFLIY